ncbi:potassium channel family protein [Breznakiella homolactica]|uniref:TrkA family potassium uptake protein n=1 Tax=Breznakiella homolactica TaxID=2798577 RepID=A0A7T8BCB2_9SPIR|nr:TrkA family potassium uptake protein [Breznakiella homolactica]QQO10068.1 TrkA family potassium uptake protein [Breznakiella homolactica]
MKQVAILGLSHFGKSVLDELLGLSVDVFIVDRDREVVDLYKDTSAGSVVLDVLNVETLRKVLPDGVDAVVIDMGDSIEASILATSYCSKLAIPTIIVKAETEPHAEILELVGATKIVFPSKEAAKRITPLLLSSVLLSYLPVSGQLAIVEVGIPEHMLGKTVMQTELRRKYNLNLISVRQPMDEYEQFDPSYRFKSGDIGLFSGTDAALEAFTGNVLKEREHKAVADQIRKFFKIQQKNS